MGAVYLARDLELGRDVAIKVFRSDVFSDPSGLERFKREARSASALNHPNIVTIYEIGSEDTVHYLVMEYVAGPTLRELLSSGSVEPVELFRVGAQLADGLEKAHRAGIVQPRTPGRRGCSAGLLSVGLVRHAVRRRDGYRSDVLWGVGAGGAFPVPAV